MDLTRARLRLYYGKFVFGPGKADLLELIDSEGSISAAGRRMGMSYKRAWNLVEEMNAGFDTPLIASSRGGAHGGGAHLTPAGQKILAHYRALMARVLDHGQADIQAIGAALAPPPSEPPAGDA